MKQIALSFALIFCSFSLFAQDWTTGTYKYNEQYEGYVVTLDGEKIGGFIKYRNRYVMQNEIIFYSEKGNSSTKKKYYPKDLKEYKVGDKLYHCFKLSGAISGRDVKANLVKNEEGCIREYVTYERASGYNTLKKKPGESDEAFGNRKFPSTAVYYKDGDEFGVDRKYFSDNFPKKMATYVSGNKALAKKIKSKTDGYKEGNFKKIIAEYNEGCK